MLLLTLGAVYGWRWTSGLQTALTVTWCFAKCHFVERRFSKSFCGMSIDLMPFHRMSVRLLIVILLNVNTLNGAARNKRELVLPFGKMTFRKMTFRIITMSRRIDIPSITMWQNGIRRIDSQKNDIWRNAARQNGIRQNAS